LYDGDSLRSLLIEAPLISREVLQETYLLLVIMAADSQAGPFLQFQASCLQLYVEPFKNLISLAASSISEI
jgi:hypothetical protein